MSLIPSSLSSTPVPFKLKGYGDLYADVTNFQRFVQDETQVIEKVVTENRPVVEGVEDLKGRITQGFSGLTGKIVAAIALAAFRLTIDFVVGGAVWNSPVWATVGAKVSAVINASLLATPINVAAALIATLFVSFLTDKIFSLVLDPLQRSIVQDPLFQALPHLAEMDKAITSLEELEGQINEKLKFLKESTTPSPKTEQLDLPQKLGQIFQNIPADQSQTVSLKLEELVHLESILKKLLAETQLKRKELEVWKADLGVHAELGWKKMLFFNMSNGLLRNEFFFPQGEALNADLVQLNALIDADPLKSRTYVSFWGTREVSIQGEEGKISIHEIAKRLVAVSEEKGIKKTLTTEERLAGIELVSKLRALYDRSDLQAQKKNRITRLFVAAHTRFDKTRVELGAGSYGQVLNFLQGYSQSQLAAFPVVESRSSFETYNGTRYLATEEEIRGPLQPPSPRRLERRHSIFLPATNSNLLSEIKEPGIEWKEPSTTFELKNYVETRRNNPHLWAQASKQQVAKITDPIQANREERTEGLKLRKQAKENFILFELNRSLAEAEVKVPSYGAPQVFIRGKPVYDLEQCAKNFIKFVKERSDKGTLTLSDRKAGLETLLKLRAFYEQAQLQVSTLASAPSRIARLTSSLEKAKVELAVSSPTSELLRSFTEVELNEAFPERTDNNPSTLQKGTRFTVGEENDILQLETALENLFQTLAESDAAHLVSLENKEQYKALRQTRNATERLHTVD